MRHLTRALALLATLLALVFTGSAAHATDEHHIDVAWATGIPSTVPASEVDGHPALWSPPQTLNPAACGVWLQVDRYVIGETTTDLLAGGVLYGPNDPAEALDYEHPFESTGHPWQYVQAPPCATEEPTQEPTPTDEPTVTPEPTDTPAVVAPPATVPPAPPVVEVHTVATPTLAATGIPVGPGILAALVLVVAGVTLVAIRGRRSPR